MFKISEEDLIDFEHTLNTIEFDQIPVGSTIANALYIEFLLGNGKWSIKDQLKDRLNIFRFSILLPSNKKKKTHPNPPKMSLGIPPVAFAKDSTTTD